MIFLQKMHKNYKFLTYFQNSKDEFVLFLIPHNYYIIRLFSHASFQVTNSNVFLMFSSDQTINY